HNSAPRSSTHVPSHRGSVQTSRTSILRTFTQFSITHPSQHHTHVATPACLISSGRLAHSIPGAWRRNLYASDSSGNFQEKECCIVRRQCTTPAKSRSFQPSVFSVCITAKL